MSGAAAFAPAASKAAITTVRQMSSEDDDVSTTPVVEAAAPVTPTPSVAGWTPDASQPCYGLPGAIAPLGYFDPLGFCNDRSLDGVKRFREAEVM